MRAECKSSHATPLDSAASLAHSSARSSSTDATIRRILIALRYAVEPQVAVLLPIARTAAARGLPAFTIAIAMHSTLRG